MTDPPLPTPTAFGFGHALHGQALHDREMGLLRRDPEQGGPAGGRLGDRPAVVGQPLHHREIALLRSDPERDGPAVGRLDNRPAVAGQPLHRPPAPRSRAG